MVTQHLCPFCGGVMYESGGKLTALGWSVTVLMGAIFCVGFIAQLFKSKNIIDISIGLGSLAFWGFIAYQLFKRFSKRRR
ncbi:hypothetical protein DXT88_14655 [Herbaspirillum lusitanum]|nr:hypothetical protein [Herbaspirillum lusitanum]